MIIDLVVYIYFYTIVLFQFGEAHKRKLHRNLEGLGSSYIRVVIIFRLEFGGMALLFFHFILLEREGACLTDGAW